MPEWRNRQTRRSQKPLSSMYGFKSHLRHHSKYSLGVDARPYSIRIEAHRAVRTINSVKNEAVTGKKCFDITVMISFATNQ